MPKKNATAKVYNWLSINSKLAKITGVKTYNWGIPAYRAANGFKTCPNAAACAIGCYAKSGAYLFSNVAKVFEKRLEFALSANFVSEMNAELKRRKVKRLRIHDSGDFFSLEYLNRWLEIIKANPETEFYAYTKMITMLRSVTLPKNFRVIFSYGGTQDKLIKTDTERHSRVFETDAALQAAGYADASKDDSIALGANPRIGLVYHGNKAYSNTNWAKVKYSK